MSSGTQVAVGQSFAHAKTEWWRPDRDQVFSTGVGSGDACKSRCCLISMAISQHWKQ